MAKEIIVNANKDQTRIAILDNGKLAELHYENAENARTLGDIYLGRVRRVMPSIRAAFVDIGREQNAFLHFSDLEENLDALLAFVGEPEPNVSTFYPAWERRNGGPNEQGADRTSPKRKRGSPDLLKRDRRILVRVVKEPIGNKGSRVSTGISLAGRFLVLVPLSDTVAVSKKIDSHRERTRLRKAAKAVVPEGFGVIVRTVAEGRADSFETDMRLLLERWKKIEAKLAGRPPGPLKVHADVSMASSIMRDLFSDEYDRILVDGRRMHRNIRNYVQAIAPHMVPRVRLYSGKESIFAGTGLEDEIEEVFDRRVGLPSGGYLFIERTEAMHVIDVNSGSSGKGMRQEESSLKVNLEAARVIARQIRLRDLGGIIVVDFIDQRFDRNRKHVLDELRAAFGDDRAVTKVLPMSDFGLIQITRQRLRPSITASYGVPHSAKKAKKDSKSVGGKPEELISAVEEWLNAYTKRKKKNKSIRLRVHPFTAAYLRHGLPSRLLRLRLRYRVGLRLETDPGLAAMQFRCIDDESGKDITKVRRRPPQRSKGAGGKPHQGPKTVKEAPRASKARNTTASRKPGSRRPNRSRGGRPKPTEEKRDLPAPAARSRPQRRRPNHPDKRRNGPKPDTQRRGDQPVSLEES